MTTKYDDLIRVSAQNAGIDPDLFRAQLVQESSLDPNAVSPAGALGIGQIMPKYWLGKHGLTTEADIRNPEKAVPAAAQIMADHVKQYGGWNQALVAYNAGPGKKNKNINAYNEGRLDLLPKETQGYLDKLGIKSNMPQAVLKNKGVLFTENPLDSNPALGQPQLTGDANAWTTPTQSVGASFLAGARGSTIGTALRMENPLAMVTPTDHSWSESELETVRGAGIGEAGVRFVLSNALNSEDIPQLIALAQENRKAAAQNRTLVGDLAYGVGEAVGDPVSYASLVIPGGIYAKGAQLASGAATKVIAGVGAVAAEGALSALASESLRETTTGTDADYATAMAGGAIFSAGLWGAGRVAASGFESVARGLNRAEVSQTADAATKGGATGVVDPTIIKEPAKIDQMAGGPQWREAVQADPINTTIRASDGDTLHPATGMQYSSHNPINPRYNDVPLPNLGGNFSVEVGDVVARSQVPEFRQMAFDLIRTSRGYTDGSSGKVGVTSQDVDAVMRGELSDFHAKWEAAREAAYSDPAYVGARLTLQEKRLVHGERIARAVEADDLSSLSKAEQESAKALRDFLAEQANLQVNPGGRWGVQADALMDPKSIKAHYFPVVVDEVKRQRIKESFGDEGAQDAVARSLFRSYVERPDVKARVDEILANHPEALDARTYAQRVAYGLVNGGDDDVTLGKVLANMEQSNLSLAGVPNFRKMRSGFEYDMEVPLADGTKFSVNDLRSFDVDAITTGYGNRVKGDVAITVGTGRTPEAFRDFMTDAALKASSDANLNKELLAFEKIVGNFYGVGIRNMGARAAAMQSMLTNLAFMKSSFYMPLLNYAEIAGGIYKHGVGFAARALPGIGKVFQDMKHGKITASNLRFAQNVVWGERLDRAILPSYGGAIDNNIRKLSEDSGSNAVNTFLGTVAGAVEAASARFYTTRLLDHTNKAIVETARQEFFADLAAHALSARKTSFANAKRMKEASVSPEQFNEMQDLLRETLRLDPKGNLEILDAGKLGSDPRAATLRRYGQYWSEQVIQQNTPGSTFRYSHLPLVGILTQFMSFVQRSVNARLIRGNSDILRNGNLGQAVSLYMIAPVLGGLGYAGTAYLQAAGMPDKKDREKFLEERLGEDGDWGPIAAGAAKRSVLGASLGWAYDTVGSTRYGQKIAPEFFQYAGFGKTSVEAKLRRDQQQQPGVIGGVLGDAIEGAPAVKILDSAVGAIKGGIDRGLAQDSQEEERAMKSLVKSIGGLMPNDPASRYVFNLFKEAAGN